MVWGEFLGQLSLGQTDRQKEERAFLYKCVCMGNGKGKHIQVEPYDPVLIEGSLKRLVGAR